MVKESNINDYVIEKVIISGAYGNLGEDTIEKIKEHFSTILKKFLESKRKTNSVVFTYCKSSNALFKTKKGKKMGILVTLRKEKAFALLKYLKGLLTPKVLNAKLKYDSRSLKMGISDHRQLKLQKFNYNAPDYGMNFNIVFSPRIIRPYKKRINKNHTRLYVSEAICRQKFEAL